MGEAAALGIVGALVAAAWWLARHRQAPVVGVRSVVPVGGGARVLSILLEGRLLLLAVSRQGEITVVHNKPAPADAIPADAAQDAPSQSGSLAAHKIR